MAKNLFRYFKTPREVIQLAVMMCVRYPHVEDLLHGRGNNVYHESIRLWVDQFGPQFANRIRTRRALYLRQHT